MHKTQNYLGNVLFCHNKPSPKNEVFARSPNSLPLEEGGFVQQNRKELCKNFPPQFIMGISAKTFCHFNSLSHGYAVPAPSKMEPY